MSTTATGEADDDILKALDFQVECDMKGEMRTAYCDSKKDHGADCWVKLQCGHDLLLCAHSFGGLVHDVKEGVGPKCLDKSCIQYYTAIIDNKRL